MRYSFTRTAYAWHETAWPSGRPRNIPQTWREEVARGSYDAMKSVAVLYGYMGPRWSPTREDEKTDRFDAGGFWYNIEEVPEYRLVLCPECKTIKHQGDNCWACDPPHLPFPIQYQCHYCGGGHKDMECHDTTDRRSYR